MQAVDVAHTQRVRYEPGPPAEALVGVQGGEHVDLALQLQAALTGTCGLEQCRTAGVAADGKHARVTPTIERLA